MTDELTPEDAETYLKTLFAKAGKPDRRYRPDEQEQLEYLSGDGAQRFKRRALGLCGSQTIKSLDEVAQLLVETGITQTPEEAKQTVPKIIHANKLDPRAINRRYLYSYLSFDEVVIPSSREVKYRITAW